MVALVLDKFCLFWVVFTSKSLTSSAFLLYVLCLFRLQSSEIAIFCTNALSYALHLLELYVWINFLNYGRLN